MILTKGEGWIFRRLQKANYLKPRKHFRISAWSLMIAVFSFRRIPALKGFPGPFVKLLLNSFSYPGIIKLMKDEADRRAIFSFAVGYFDGEKDHIFVANEEGFITDEPRGDNLHGWTELLYIYGHPSFPGRSLAELNDEEWQEYLTIIEKVDGLAMLRDYLIDA